MIKVVSSSDLPCSGNSLGSTYDLPMNIVDMTLASVESFADRVLEWFQKEGRKNLPWQKNPTAYRVWVSEIMLQQTQVSTVIPYYQRFMERFPAVGDLAAAEQDEVLQYWAGLGYYARGRNLHKCARVIVGQYRGMFPDTVDALESLPGIGRSTAGAIISLALDRKAAILDGNVKRVLARFYAVDGWPGQTAVAKRLWEIAEKHTPQSSNRSYTQAMMDLGATVCTRSRPNCESCPLISDCEAFDSGHPSRYPGKKPKKAIPVRQKQFLLIENMKGQWVLEQRQNSGIWGGMWSLPELTHEDDAAEYVEKHVGEVKQLTLLEPFRHTFSHYHLDITPLLLRVKPHQFKLCEPESRRWFDKQDGIDSGVPAPIKKILLGQL